MGHETELRGQLSTVYVLLSGRDIDPERLRIASEKMDEVVGVLSGLVSLPAAEGERG